MLLYEMMGFRTPFYDKNRKMMFQAIISSAINFPVFFSDDARDCLEGLLKKDPHARLGSGAGGADEIKAHAFYAPLDFGELFDRKVPAPFKPEVASELDVKYVPKTYLQARAEDSIDPAAAKPARGAKPASEFSGFTYVQPSKM